LASRKRSYFWLFLSIAISFRIDLDCPQPQSALLAQGVFALGISFFTFEFLHYAFDRYRGKTETGRSASTWRSFCFFPRWSPANQALSGFFAQASQHFRGVVVDAHRGITRILAGLVKKFAVADLLTAYTNHLNVQDVALRIASFCRCGFWRTA